MNRHTSIKLSRKHAHTIIKNIKAQFGKLIMKVTLCPDQALTSLTYC